MTQPELQAFLDANFPRAMQVGEVVEVGARHVRVRMAVRPEMLRPGGTIMGPALMTLADTTMYFALLVAIGPVLDLVTTSLDIHFLRRPVATDVEATARVLRIGRRMAVGTVELCSVGDPEPVAHATVSYALPT